VNLVSNPPRFKVGDTAPGGEKIVLIYGESERMLVFRDPSYSICHWIDSDEYDEKDRATVARFEGVLAKVYDLLPRRMWKRFADDLGIALFKALSATDSTVAELLFSNLEKRVSALRSAAQRLGYLVSALGTATITIIIAIASYSWLLSAPHRLFAFYAAMAVLGALSSVIQRAGNIEVDVSESDWQVALRGFFRILFAVALACFFVVACRANLVAGFASNDPYVVGAFSFLVGWSERFVTDILSRLEGQSAGPLGGVSTGTVQPSSETR